MNLQQLEQSPKRRSARLLFALGLGYLILRVILLHNPGHTFDLDLYREWLLKVGESGVTQVYRTSNMDYPPLYAYILEPFAWIYRLLSGFGWTGLATLTVLVKLPPTLFDLGIAAVLWRYARLNGHLVGASLAVVAAYLLNPAVLFDVAYWGEPDSIHSFVVLASFITVGIGLKFWLPIANLRIDRRSSAICFGWSFMMLGALMKPLALPYFPLLLFITGLLAGIRGAVIGLSAAVITGCAVFLPFLVSGQGAEVFERVFTDMGAMPFTSANAHNLWWAVGAWNDSEVPLIGPLTATQTGIGLFGISCVTLCWTVYHRHKVQKGMLLPSQILAVAAMVGFSFFIVSTHLHENHLFTVVALLSPLVLEHRVWRNLFILVSIAVFINCWLHGIPMDYPHWPFTIGGATAILHPPHYDRTYFVGELVVLWMSVLFNLAVYGWAMVGIFRPGSRNWLALLFQKPAKSIEKWHSSTTANGELL